ncbi:hypothetical protein EV714DRAFT_205583, partial [Schizophyllum commune]
PGCFVHDPAITTILYLHSLSFICLSLSPSRIYASHITLLWGQTLPLCGPTITCYSGVDLS